MEENNTVYAVEESEKGMTLSHYLHLRSRTLTPAEARTLLQPALVSSLRFRLVGWLLPLLRCP